MKEIQGDRSLFFFFFSGELGANFSTSKNQNPKKNEEYSIADIL